MDTFIRQVGAQIVVVTALVNVLVVDVVVVFTAVYGFGPALVWTYCSSVVFLSMLF